MKSKRCWLKSLSVAVWLTTPGMTLADVVLRADDHDGKDNVWKARYAAGKNSWGIDGTGNPLNGNMWWNSFRGQTGKYKVELGAVIEPDGNSRYRFFIDNNKAHEGRYPYSTGSLNCNSSTLQAVYLDMGEHQIQQGAAIKFWGESVYPCGSNHGQYTRYWEIKFTLQEPQGNQAPIIDSISAEPNPTSSGTEVSFSSSAHDPDQDPLTYAWDFGDGTGAMGANVKHAYTSPGDYNVTLQVEDGQHPGISRSLSMHVVDPSMIVLEAEDMDLDGYQKEGEYIATMTSGEATVAFPGPTNNYRVDVVIIKEDDGQPTLEVLVGQTRIATLHYPLGNANREPQTMDLGVFAIQAGDTIKLIGQLDQGAAARVDKLVFRPDEPGEPVTISGEAKTWHTQTLSFSGPNLSENSDPNPFLDYRLQVTFSQAGKSYVVPGYFAADGKAQDTGALSGDQWRVHFIPDAPGEWTYQVSFRMGSDIAIDENPNAGDPVSIDGMTGTLQIARGDKTGRDFRAHGLLRYVGKHHLQFAESGRYFLKGGADSPENFLAYADFDQTPDTHKYLPHADDWKAGDPTWMGNKGKTILGAISYLAEKGMNSVYFLTMNVTGDGDDVWPWTSKNERYRFDVSKLDQWEVVFTHMTQKGVLMHVLTQETENDQLLDGGALGTQRRLYYRELIARFSHHLGLVWNLGEENTNTDKQRRDFAAFIRNQDPWDHPIVVHTYPGEKDKVFTPLLGYEYFEGPSCQNGNNTHAVTKKWIDASAAAGRKWVVNLDEIGPANVGVKPDADDPEHNQVRKTHLWGNLMAGGGGVEWYFGYGYAHNDLNCEDWRSRDAMWDQTRYALDFFQTYLPFSEMTHADDLSDNEQDFVFAQEGQIYAIYLPDGGTTQLDLGQQGNEFSVGWYNPRTGGDLQNGTLTTVSGPGLTSLGFPPNETHQDWVALVRLENNGELYALTVIDGSGSGNHRAGTPVNIQADPPGPNQVFDQWVGDISTVEDHFAAATILTMPAKSTTVTATYQDTASSLAVVGLTLMDADADAPISAYDPMPTECVLNLAKLPTRNLSIVAHTQPSEVGSVQFILNGQEVSRENSFPYAIVGDNHGDLLPWTPQSGQHTLEVTPFENPDLSGLSGTPMILSLEVRDEPDQNALPSVVILEPTENKSFRLPTSISIRAKAEDLDGQIAKVAFTANGIGLGEATSNPYLITWEPTSAGVFSLEATATDDSGGVAQAQVTVEILPSDSGEESQAGCHCGSQPTGVLWFGLFWFIVIQTTIRRRQGGNLR